MLRLNKALPPHTNISYHEMLLLLQKRVIRHNITPKADQLAQRIAQQDDHIGGHLVIFFELNF